MSDRINIYPAFRVDARDPRVGMYVPEHSMSLTPADARKLAARLVAAAEAAECEGFIVSWLTDLREFSGPQLGALLDAYRAYRQKQEGEPNG